MNAQTPSRRPSTRDHVSGAPPLRLASGEHMSGCADAPVDMAAHVTTTTRRVLAIVAFIALCHAQFSIYTDVALPVLTGQSAFVLDEDGPRLESPYTPASWRSWFAFGHKASPLDELEEPAPHDLEF